METASKTQRRKVQRRPAEPTVIRLELKDNMGNPRWVTADLVDVIDGGFGLALRISLKPGSTVVVRGKLGERRTGDGSGDQRQRSQKRKSSAKEHGHMGFVVLDTPTQRKVPEPTLARAHRLIIGMSLLSGR